MTEPAESVVGMPSERQKLRDWLDGLSAVAVEYAPAHSAPYISKYIVMPGVEAFVDRIEEQAVTAYKESLTKIGRTIMSLARVQELVAIEEQARLAVAPDERLREALAALVDSPHGSLTKQGHHCLCAAHETARALLAEPKPASPAVEGEK